MNTFRVAAITRALQLGHDLLFAGLLVLVVVQAGTDGRALIAAGVFAVVYVAGRLRVDIRRRPVRASRGAWWPDGAWMGALFLAWVVLLLAGGPGGIWLAFPLTLLQMHVLGPLRGVAAVVATTAVAVAGGLAQDLNPVGAVLGPVIGAAVAVGVVLGLEAVLRESEERQELIGELVATRERLAASEHARGVAAERERLAREIHDTLAQGFSSIELLLRVAEETGDDSGVARARQVARDNLAEARRFVRGLAPADLAESSVDEAIGRVVGRVVGPQASLTVTGEPRVIPVEVAAALVRVAQSALANVEQHAGASRVDVTLSYVDGAVVLDVVDDGTGFDGELGFGLRALRSRIEDLGGQVDIETGPSGTAVAVEVPT
ncbi:sensor histidine kinase [Aeromicrobium piscarium]|uniref:Sensor histidine kinase n=1 Tax=Aeromicrobium piscarium TaxID=2590901 RepID=A0A554RX93_9ACTN|nr:sensor histidine kinase [Aeromicrobium piscarium]TSD58717.1 sensor histidine kinase [Aeromicrobium piscarium]